MQKTSFYLSIEELVALKTIPTPLTGVLAPSS